MILKPNSKQTKNSWAEIPSGQIKNNQIVIMNGGQGAFFPVELAEALKEKYRFVSKSMGKPPGPLRQSIHEAGLSNSTKNHAEFVEPPFLIDRHAVFFLHSHPQICDQQAITLEFSTEQARQRILALSGEKETAVYLHLAGQYFLTDGHKFGCTFLAYDQDPEIHHAKALVFIEDDKAEENVRQDWEHQISRLAGIAKKDAWRARVTKEGVHIQKVQRHRSRRHEQPRT